MQLKLIFVTILVYIIAFGNSQCKCSSKNKLIESNEKKDLKGSNLTTEDKKSVNENNKGYFNLRRSGAVIGVIGTIIIQFLISDYWYL
jgi:hypothetical protein